jgi:K+-transporting ATPase ATPase C chain
MLRSVIFPAARMLLVLTVLTGIIYPLIITLAAGLIFPAQANGSLQMVNVQMVGSELIAQKFESNRYFWPRPSATDYNVFPSGGSNLGPTSTALQKAVQERAAVIRQSNDLADDAVIPSDLLFASASGLDPHISPEAAQLQVDRVAATRHVPAEKVAALVDQFTEGPQFGLLGQPRVNVLLLNLALDRPGYAK